MSTIFIGFPRSGKTTIAKYMAQKTKRPYLDTDQCLEAQYHLTHPYLSAAQIYQQEGMDYFRALEKKIIQTLQPHTEDLIATGGGAVLDPDNRAHLQSLGTLIYLECSPTELHQRLHNKPSFLKEASIQSLYETRHPLYCRIANHRIVTDQENFIQLADKLIALGY